MRTKMFFAALFLSGVAFVAMPQIDVRADGEINIRNGSLGNKYTLHYGNLQLEGGVGSTTWGWFRANMAIVDYGTSLNTLEAVSSAVLENLFVFGNKSFLSPHPTDTGKFIRYCVVESGEHLTIIQGVARTENGLGKVVLPEHFSLVTNKDEPLTVALTPEGEPVLLYTKQKKYERNCGCDEFVGFEEIWGCYVLISGNRRSGRV